MSVVITNRKSHAGFRLIPTSVTLNDLERRNSPHFAFSRRPNSIALLANYVIVVKDRPYSVPKILSPIYSLPLLAITNRPCSAVSLR